jgi:ankyrin repeat protein
LQNGSTVLHVACEQDRADVVTLLLAASGINVNAADKVIAPAST